MYAEKTMMYVSDGFYGRTLRKTNKANCVHERVLRCCLSIQNILFYGYAFLSVVQNVNNFFNVVYRPVQAVSE